MNSLPHHVFTSQEIRCVEHEHAANNNGHCYDLMELAGASVFESMMSVNPHPRMVYVLVGKGNNGGDGYIVASYLLKRHIPFRLFAVGKPHEGSEAHTAYRYFTRQLNGTVEYNLPSLEAEAHQGNSPDIVIDALLGTGLESAPRDPFDQWINFINSTRAYVISVDVPSGVNADTGEVYADCVRANRTITMIGLKCGLVTGDAVDFTGEIEVKSLGIDIHQWHGRHTAADMDGAPYVPVYLQKYEDIKSDLPVRSPSFHKGNAGKLALIGGCQGMGGAICLTGMGALRTGAGLVKILTDKSNVQAINAQRPELMTADFQDPDAVTKALEWADVVAIGPGLGQSKLAESLLEQVLTLDIPVVLDADALNLLAKRGLSFSKRLIMTPHPGEAARLLGISVEKVNADRFHAVYELQSRCGGVVLLKGAGTLVCDGKKTVIVHEGSPAMASGGMGDLLTGIIAALRAQGVPQMPAAVAGACIHGRAGKLAGNDGGVVGTLALDLLPYMRCLVNRRPGLALHHENTNDISNIEIQTEQILAANHLL